MNKYVSNYINEILKQVKYKKAHKAISVELENHIEELMDDYMADGLSEKDAANTAISQMGNADDIGRRLHSIHRPKTEWSIILLIGVIIALGLYMMLSYSVVYWDTDFFYKQLILAGVGAFVLAALYFFDYKKLEKYSIHLYLASTLLMLFAMISGIRINGKTYLFIFGIGFDSTIIVIPFLVVSYSGVVKRWFNGKPKGMFKLLGMASLPIFICLLQPSLANAFIISIGFLSIITFSIFDKTTAFDRKRLLLLLYGSLSGAFIILFFFITGNTPYIINRLRVFINPEIDPNGAGYLNTVLHRLLHSSLIFGNSGDLISTRGDIVYRLPGGSFEFIFTFIISSFGWFLGLALVFLLSIFIIRMFIAANKISDSYGKYLSFGICCIFSIQVFVNILMNLGLFPIIGIGLPLVSYGGASFLCNMSLIGMLLGIYRRKDIAVSEVR